MYEEVKYIIGRTKMDIFNEVQQLLGFKLQKLQKELWVQECLPVIVEVNKQIRALETAMEEEMAPFKSQVKAITEKYQVAIKPLNEMDKRLRERVLKEHVSTDPVIGTGIGKLVFPETWTYEIKDIKKVDKEYRVEVVDINKVKTAIKNGIRNIKGIEIKQERSVRVYTKAEGDGEK